MSIESSGNQQDNISPHVQRQKARHLLTTLQWVCFAVLLVGLIWLYVIQQRQYSDIIQRVQSTGQVTDRINVLEDKLIANSQQPVEETLAESNPAQNQSEAQLEQIRLQIQAAEILSNNQKITEAIQLLRGIKWQLKQPNNVIAPALSTVLTKSLDTDIAELQTVINHPDGWQEQALAIQAIQKYLYTALNNKNSATKTASASPTLKTAIISPQDAIVYDVLMQLNLAQQAATNQDAAMLQLYLTQSAQRLSLIERGSSPRTPAANDVSNVSADIRTEVTNNTGNASANTNVGISEDATQSSDKAKAHISQKAVTHQVHTLNSIGDAVALLQQLAQQQPTPFSLTTMKVVSVPADTSAQ